jgi:hypothetical protein
MVTQAYYTDPHTQVYLNYLNYMARREREREERKRQEEAGGGPLGAGIGAGVGALAGTLIAPGIGTAIGAQVGGQAGGAIGTGISPPGGPAGAARSQAWQQGIGTLTDLGVTAATYRDLQAPHEAPGQSPSFMEVFAGQQGYGARGLANLYGERRDLQRDAAYQQQIQDRQLKVEQARQQYRQGMEGAGFKLVVNPRAVQSRMDEIQAILNNEGNLTPLQQEQALSIVGQKPLDMMVQRVPQSFQQIRGATTEELPDGSVLGLSRNNEVREIQKPWLPGKDYAALYGLFEEEERSRLPKDQQNAPLSEAAHARIVNKIGRIVGGMRAQRSGQMPPVPPQLPQQAPPQGVPPPPQPKGMGWYDRAKIAASIPLGIMGGAGAQQAGGPQQPGQQGPPSPVEQTASQLMDMVESLGGDVGKWPKEARQQGKVLAQRFQAELQAQFGDPKNTPAELLPVLEIVAKLL